MFGSPAPQKPQKRHKPPRKPPWTDPETRITDATATRVTLGPRAAELIPYADMFRSLDLLDWYFTTKQRGRRKRGGR